MGLFDSILVKCPACKDVEFEFQSKGGECLLYRYTIRGHGYDLDEAPLGVLAGVWYAVRCSTCRKVYRLRIPEIVKAELVEAEADYEGEIMDVKTNHIE